MVSYNLLDGELVSSGGEQYVLDEELQYAGCWANKQSLEQYMFDGELQHARLQISQEWLPVICAW